jgi:AraC-like DNA-binding protein
MYRERKLSWAAEVWTASGGGSDVVAADGCVDLIWRDGHLMLSGPTTQPLIVGGEAATTGLRLRPGVAAILLGGSMGELANRCVPVSDVGLSLPQDAVAFASDEPLPGLAGLYTQLSQRADAAELALRAALIRMSDSGQSAQAVASDLGLSERQARRHVHRLFGYSYRTLGGIRRAQRAGAALAQGGRPAEVAVRCGFSDQSHLTREVARYLGRTPAQLARIA